MDPGAETLQGYVATAIREGSWHHVAFHGVGPDCEWGGPVDGNAFLSLLDYLVEKRVHVWTGTHTEVHKYDRERGATDVMVLETSSRRIRLRLTSPCSPFCTITP